MPADRAVPTLLKVLSVVVMEDVSLSQVFVHARAAVGHNVVHAQTVSLEQIEASSQSLRLHV